MSYSYIQLNSDRLWRYIAVDVDKHKDGGAWIDLYIPEPTWTVYTRRGVQFVWQLDKPILAGVEAHRNYALDTLAKLIYALDGDPSAFGFNRIFRNPLAFDNARYRGGTVDLGDFRHLPAPPPAARKRKEETDQDELRGMREGDGRNCALFDAIRLYAYEQNNKGAYTEFDLAHYAHQVNAQFAEPLQHKEVEDTIKSVDKFIREKHGKGGYMGKLTKEERTERARKNGQKGGRSRRAEAYGRILATINQMQSFDIKITVSELARRAKSDRKTVRAYLLEKNWREVSRKEGWKQIKERD